MTDLSTRQGPAIRPAIRPAIDWEHVSRLAAGAVMLVIALVIIVLPLYALLSQSFEDHQGNFVGLANFVSYAKDPILRQSLINSLWVAALTVCIVVPLGFLYSYALTRSCMPLRGLFKGIALLPILAPSLLPAIALIYIFGNQGYLKWLMFGNSIYGPVGIIMAQVFHCFPFVVLIMTTALATADARLYEAAETLNTSRWRIFWTITFPGARYGLINASFVVFTTAIVDFGIAKVIGGKFNMLAVDVYRQIIGQANFQMGAVIGVILLLPAVLTFVVERITYKHQTSQLTSRAVMLQPKRSPRFDRTMLLAVALLAIPILGIIGTAIFASFVTLWPYNLAFSFNNFNFGAFDPGGWLSYWNSVEMAAWTALFGTIMAFTGAYLTEKHRKGSQVMLGYHIVAMVPLAVPGIVLGLGYVFFFNMPSNPLNFIYGTMIIMVLCTIGHYYTVPHLMALTALKQIDAEFEAASQALGVSFWTTLRRVTIPISIPAIIDMATYFFVNAMTTVAGVIFIYASTTKVASIAVVALNDTGDEGAACAMAMMILYTSAGVKLLQVIVTRLLLRGQQQWRSNLREA
ncbi:2-aminoethylphosphonate ABC transport system, permease protein [Ancylobacter novellus DSM 506]|uniref:2-aminoethylphosphonate ABC transport system, permease protein n=1 Tax=Ancylobacter novellus (strain ATCC 8093 / DSM 506 / JCM 20403 / CCM 1077 / IAM 12100 / NBRC 12443 / NCIMB 10456) TaxID=639283 RepID=D7AA09_ANCN5|nr:putative 2-aminoethylphosphonate ABC transporter permease subunit [Ancylobacter novellus]ADH90796.1 2-aminoethylphosphonate ABC transport system, permease protein [Ancylobacter novellus DSM 506]